MSADPTAPDRTTLCLTLKSGQAVFVGDSRFAVEFDRGRIRVRITADRDVTILRETLLHRQHSD